MRAGLKPYLLTYEGEGHTIGGQMNTLDQTARVMDYFDYYLKKTVAADWILEGRTYLKKERRRIILPDHAGSAGIFY